MGGCLPHPKEKNKCGTKKKTAQTHRAHMEGGRKCNQKRIKTLAQRRDDPCTNGINISFFFAILISRMVMEKKIDAESLALESIAALDEACKLVEEEISATILAALDEYIERPVSVEGCDGIFDFHEDQEDYSTWFASNDWLIKDEEEALEDAFLWCGLREINKANSEEYNKFYITSLIGIGAQNMCFSISISRSLFPKLGKRECRNFLQNIFEKNKLREQCLNYDGDGDGAINIPFIVDHRKLILAYQNEEFSEVFEPVGKAIEKAKEVMEMFSVPLKELQEKYPLPKDD